MRLIALGAMTCALSGCIHIHRTALVATQEQADRVRFPDWGASPVTVSGPHLRALQIAMDDFRPLGSGHANTSDALSDCLQHVQNYDVLLQRAEGVTFIHFTPKEEERCGLPPTAADVGASYAVDDQGVILKRE